MKVEVTYLNEVKPCHSRGGQARLTLDVHLQEFEAEQFFELLWEEYGDDWIRRKLAGEGYNMVKREVANGA